METLRGVIERITYHSEETGFTVAKLLPENRARGFGSREREITITGNLLGVHVGESIEAKGHWKVHGEYGKQFEVQQMHTVLPATVAGLEKYLGSGLIKGVGPVTAKRIVKCFGMDTLDIIEENPERLAEVPGVGQKRTRLIAQAWAEQRAIKEVMLFLQSHGVSTSLATRIYKTYGDESILIVQQDPYRLARDIFGIGFMTADKIAQAMGIPEDSPQRVAAGVAYALNQAADEGHVYLPADKLVEQAAELLGVTPQQAGLGIVQLWESDQVRIAATGLNGVEEWSPPTPTATLRNDPTREEGVPQLLAERGGLYAAATFDYAQSIVEEKRPVYLTSLFYSEKGTATRIQRLLHEGKDRLERFRRPDFDWQAALQASAQATGVSLAPAQEEAVRAALTHRLVVLTGGPGTGKTTTVRTILHLCLQAGYRVLLATPTGRAAKRLAETTGQEAKTLHRLLEFKPSEGMTFQRNEENPLEGDLLIVDEASMLDLVLAHHLLKAVPPGMPLLLVGDVDQLPSVGAGNVLKDLIAAIEGATIDPDEDFTSNRLPTLIPGIHLPNAEVVRLQTIFRQEANSFIITNAHRINQGEMPLIANDTATDFFLFKTEDAQRAAALCVELVQSRIPRRFAIPPQDIQVLCPMHRGVAGVAALNEALQAAINPPQPNKAQRQIGTRAYRVGDRVMQIRNNYTKDVYNGDMGIIQDVDLEMQTVTVCMDGRLVVYDFLELDELTHAFAISVHKSQGSEFPAVVIPVLTSHYLMLQRNLLYTAVSRARRLVVLVGQPKAIAMAVRNNKVTERYTGLRERLELG